METGKDVSAWETQQAEAVRRMHEGGGRPGLAQAAQIADLSGRQILEAMMSGRLPYPPMNETANMTLLEIDEGRAVFQGVPSLRHYNPLGCVHGGWFATLLDSALGCAVQTLLPAGRGYVTVGLNLNIVRPASDRSGPLRACAQVVHPGGRIVTAEARLTDEKGQLYAHASTTCLVITLPRT